MLLRSSLLSPEHRPDKPFPAGLGFMLCCSVSTSLQRRGFYCFTDWDRSMVLASLTQGLPCTAAPLLILSETGFNFLLAKIQTFFIFHVIAIPLLHIHTV